MGQLVSLDSGTSAQVAAGHRRAAEALRAAAVAPGQLDGGIATSSLARIAARALDDADALCRLNQATEQAVRDVAADLWATDDRVAADHRTRLGPAS